MPGRCRRQCRQGPATRRTAGLAKLSAFCCCCFLYGDQTGESVCVSSYQETDAVTQPVQTADKRKAGSDMLCTARQMVQR